MLTQEERTTLLVHARDAAHRALGIRGHEAPPPAGEQLLEPGACFVTWKRDGRLRGCIGSVEARRPLVRDVEENAVAALLKDPRFPPSTPRDYPRLSLEISVLGPLEEVNPPAGIEIGRHGLSIEKGNRRGILLPQVPVEWKWDVLQFLEQLCLKAGLPPSAWQEGSGARVYRFEAEVFGESA